MSTISDPQSQFCEEKLTSQEPAEQTVSHISAKGRRKSTLKTISSWKPWFSNRSTLNANDPEPKEMRHGNCALASFMSKHPEVGIFERFGDLNAYNLLALQSELCYLREDFYDAADDKDAIYYELDDPERRMPLDCNIHELSMSDSKQWKILLKIQDKLKTYNEALLQQIELTSRPNPTKHNLSMLQSFLTDPKGCDYQLRGEDSTLWNDKSVQSFVSLSGSHADRDLFSRWTGDTFLKWWHEKIVSKWIPSRCAGDEESGFTTYDDNRIASAAHIISTFLSSLLATLPMFALFGIENLKIRLGLVMAFTTIFSVTLAVFSKARRIEIFAATAAFAAVRYLKALLTLYALRETWH